MKEILDDQVFKTAAIDRSAIPPRRKCKEFCAFVPADRLETAGVSPKCNRQQIPIAQRIVPSR